MNKYLKRDFKLITKNFKFYDDIINRLLNCKYTKRRNRIILNKMKNILNKKRNSTFKKS